MFNKISQHIKRPHVRYGAPVAFFGLSIVSLFITLSLLLVSTDSSDYSKNLKYTVYSAKPLVLGYSTSNIRYSDSRAEAIDKVMERYGCPMTGLGETFVKEADANDIPYWLVASIAFQESSCGKNTPRKDGKETYNAYGYGVWGTNVKAFDNWEHGIKVMSTYMHDMFYSKDVTELCEIMETYTPPSNGSWCRGVAYFRDEITQYQSPEL